MFSTVQQETSGCVEKENVVQRFLFLLLSYLVIRFIFSLSSSTNKLHFDNKKQTGLLSACSYRSPVRDPAFPQSTPPYTVQQHSPDRNTTFDGGRERFYGKQLCWICSSSLSLFFFFYLMNEISHAALLQALAHLGGSALSLFLSLSPSLMPSNTLLPFVNYWHTFWQQTQH